MRDSFLSCAAQSGPPGAPALQAARVQFHQLRATLLLRQRKFNGLVNTTRPRSQCGFEMVGTVRGQNEKGVPTLRRRPNAPADRAAVDLHGCEGPSRY